MKQISGKVVCKVVEKHGWQCLRLQGSMAQLKAKLEGVL